MMAIFEVLPDGRNDWHFSHEFDTYSQQSAAEKFAEYIDFTSTEFTYVKEGGIVQVRLKGQGKGNRYVIHGEARPHYEAKMLPLPAPPKEPPHDAEL